MKLTIIGDVHEKVHQYKKIIDKSKFSICVGDFGFEPEWGWLAKSVDCLRHKVLMGNHDYYPVLNTHLASIAGSLVLGHYSDDIFCVRGADSIDKHLRIEGLDWFANEELSYQEGLELFDYYIDSKPRIVISHDCPQSVMNHFWKYSWSFGKSNTRNLLEAMFNEHQPEFWFFGHHRESKDELINGTRFICLYELETFELEL
jgi:hypothetical protein